MELALQRLGYRTRLQSGGINSHVLLAGIIDPCDTEGNHALWLNQALDDVDHLRVLREHRLHGGQHLLHSLANADSVFKILC